MSTVENGNKGPSGIWPVSVAVGIAVLLVGLVVNLLLVAVGGAIAVCAAVLWAREARSGGGRQAAAAAPLVERRALIQAERFPRSGLVTRATVGLGALVGLGVALPATGAAILSSLGGGRQRPVDLGPVNAFPEGQYVIATFLSDPEAGEVSRRAAPHTCATTAWSAACRASRSSPAAAPMSAARPSPTARRSRAGWSGRAPARSALLGRSRRGSVVLATAASSTPRATGRPALRRGRSTATGSRSGTAAWCSARATASPTSAVPVRQPGSKPSR
jgi:hypothetical protein